MKHAFARIGLCALLPLGLAACRSSQAATPPSASSSIPSDEVWLTAEEASAAHLDVVKTEDRDLDDEVMTNGVVTTDASRVGHVFSPVTGRVVAITAKLGEHVRKGAPLATIESPDVGVALSDVSKAEADLVAAGHDYQREKTMYEDHATAASSVERARDAWRKASAEAERARAKARLLSGGWVGAVHQSYTLLAPIDGDVLARNVSPGVEVQGQYGGGTAQELFTIGDVGRVWVLGDVYESDLSRMHVGATADVTVIAHHGRVLHGTVDWVSSALDPDTRTAKIRCVLDNADGALLPNMYATMQVKADPIRKLAIPRASVTRFGEYQVVFVRAGQAEGDRVRYVRTPVDADESGAGEWLAVRHGIAAGQDVVVRGVPELLRRL